MYNQARLVEIIEAIKGDSSLRSVAKTLGTDASYLSKILNYKRKTPPTPEMLKRMANGSRGYTTYNELLYICGYTSVHFDPTSAERIARERGIKVRNFDVTGLTDEDIQYIETQINYLKRKNKK